MSRGDLTIGPGKLQLHHDYRPPLVAGRYELRLDQHLELSEIDEEAGAKSFGTRRVMHVHASRFRFEPTDVHAVYPPANSEGQYEETLPHIVLRRRGLPWQVSLDGTADGPPWLALLLFQDGEAPEVVTRPLAELIAPAEAGVVGPTLDLGIDAATDRTQTIDVPAELFARIAPRREELSWLAHVRQVNTGGKELLGLDEDGWFAVVLGNRLPGVGENTAHLVSIEGWQDRLGSAAPGTAAIRLVSLATWTFAAKPARGSFKELVQGLSNGLLRAPLPPVPAPARGSGPAGPSPDQVLRRALEQGYVPLSYDMRQGEATAAWYRGPLLPVVPPRVSDRGPFLAAESGLIYDDASGMFDVSCAVAWQIGRLLALSDGGFAGALTRWRQEGQRLIDRVLERERTQRKFARVKLFEELATIVERPPAEQEELLKALLARLTGEAPMQQALADGFGQLMSLDDPERGLPRVTPTQKALLLRGMPALDGAALARVREMPAGAPRAAAVREWFEAAVEEPR